jgi:hypothetical protein
MVEKLNSYKSEECCPGIDLPPKKNKEFSKETQLWPIMAFGGSTRDSSMILHSLFLKLNSYKALVVHGNPP